MDRQPSGAAASRKITKRGREQNHRQVIAEAERVGGEEQPRAGRASAARAHRRASSSVSATKTICSAYTSAMIDWLQNVYEVAKSSAAAAPAATDPLSSTPTRTITAHASGALHRRRQVQRVRGSPGIDPVEERADGGVERVAVARCEQGRADSRLERRRVAQVHPGQQRRAVEREGDDPDGDGGQQSAVGAPGISLLRLAAMTARISASGRVFTTCRRSTQPRRAVVTPSSICMSSSSARWQSLSTATMAPAAIARRASAPSRSRWAGDPSISTIVPVSTAISKSAS